MNIIKEEEEREDQEWEALTLKDAKQMMDDAVAYQKYWNEQMSDLEKEWGRESPTKFSVWVGLFTHTTMEVSMTVAKRLLKEMWQSAENDVNITVENGIYSSGHVYVKIEATKFRLSFHVRTELKDHRNQHIFDKVKDYKDGLFAEQKQEEE